MPLENDLNIPTLDEVVELDSTDGLGGLFGDAPHPAAPGTETPRMSTRDKSRLKREIVAALTAELERQIGTQTEYVLETIRPQLEETIRKRILAELGNTLHTEFPELSRDADED